MPCEGRGKHSRGPLRDTQSFPQPLAGKISNIAQSSPGFAATCDAIATAAVRQSEVARYYRPLRALKLEPLCYQRGLLSPTILFFLHNFLVSVSLSALLLLLGVGLGTFAMLCFRRAKKKKVEVSETAFRC